MDKYIRKDDTNDDLGVYDNESYPGMTIFDSESSPQQPLQVFGKSKSEKEMLERLKQALRILTPREYQVYECIVRYGFSIRESAKQLSMYQSQAQRCWNNIKKKLKK